MKVTDVQLRLADPDEGRMRAYARVVLDDELVLYDLKLVEGNDRLFLSMPQKPARLPCYECRRKVPAVDNYCSYCGVLQDPKRHRTLGRLFLDWVHPITRDFRDHLEEAVIAAYNNLVHEPQVSESVAEENVG